MNAGFIIIIFKLNMNAKKGESRIENFDESYSSSKNSKNEWHEYWVLF